MSMQPVRETNKESVRHARAVTPRVDVFENADELLLVVDLPGVSKDGLTVSVEKDTLTLVGKVAAREGNATKIAGERRAEVFERAFALPEGLDPERITAQLKNGVATIRLPKAEKAKPRRIPIQ
jgi:HSP20 family molecular chaperone IbpA